jgi:glucokinase
MTSLKPLEKFVLCVDLGGTQVRAALCKPMPPMIVRRMSEPTEKESPDKTISQIARMCKAVSEGVPREQIEAVGIGSPGPLNPSTGVVYEMPNLSGWHNVPLADRISQELGLKTFLNNDANVAALGEYRFGAGKGTRNMIYITVSTGIGGGIIVDGRLLLGARGLAAEIGHHIVEAHGVRCNCGNIGCLEAYASGTAIARMAAEAVQSGAHTSLSRLGEITARGVAGAAREGDEVSLEIMRTAGFYLGVGIVNLLHIFNPSKVILGGSVTKSYDLFEETMWNTIRDRAWPPYLQGFSISLAELGDDVGLIGAMALVLEELGKGV